MITKKDLENYIKLGKCIVENRKKLAHYSSKYPYAIHGRVNGSSSQYPYVKRTFTVDGGGFYSGGMNEEKRLQKIIELQEKIKSELQEYEDKKLEIEEFLLTLDDLDAKLLFTHIYVNGLSQEETGELIGLEQSGVSKKLGRYIKLYVSN